MRHFYGIATVVMGSNAITPDVQIHTNSLRPIRVVPAFASANPYPPPPLPFNPIGFYDEFRLMEVN